MAQAIPAVAPFQSASLYVGDLHPEITENVLFDLFNRVGPVASIRVCRDSITRRSLGYAYVNFHNVQDAERALDTMNFSDITGRPCRIMWSQRDPSLRKTGLGNVFVRNLAASVDHKGLYDTFSVFGNILSCKVAQDDKGNSKRYGYVHFETAEAAIDAIQKLDGMFIDDVKVSVSHFVRRQDRASQNNWTNLYLKQFPVTWSEDKLREVFSQYGKVLSVAISKDMEGKSKGFGFVNLDTHENASKAVAEQNGKTVDEDGHVYLLYVGRAQKKSEREREMRSKQEQVKLERATKYQNMNLYVKNIADNVTDEQFKDAFAAYGTITSARIMREKNDAKTSKGFGFVCFASSEEATKAVSEMNGKPLGGKPLVVTLYQRIEQRRAQLAANYAPQNMRFPAGVPAGMPMPFPMYQAAFPGQPPRGAPVPFAYNPRGMANPRGMPNAPFNRNGFFAPPQYMQPGQGQPMYAPRGRPQGVPGQVQRPGVPQPRPMFAAPMGFPQAPRGNIKFTPQARNQVPGMVPMQMQPQQVPVPVAGPAAAAGGNTKMDFSEALLATADPMQQKNMIGERLFPLIYQVQPDLAGKITGMLLEMDNAELINLIESPDALASKIDEALAVLRSHAHDN